MPEISFLTLLFVAAFAALYLYSGICTLKRLYLTASNPEETEFYIAYAAGNRAAILTASVFYLTWPAWMAAGYLNAKRLDYLNAKERNRQ